MISAQIYTSSVQYTAVAGLGNSAEATGVAVRATFDFATVVNTGFLRVTLANLSGTLIPGGGGSRYTEGTLMGFGFDTPWGLNYINNSFTKTFESPAEPDGVTFTQGNPGYSFRAEV